MGKFWYTVRMERHTFEVGLYGVNCSILSAGARALVVDPGAEADRIAAFLSETALVPSAILLTHAHFDHIGGIPALLAKFPALPVLVNAPDVAVLTHPFNQLPPDYPPVARPATLTTLDRRTSLPDFAPGGAFAEMQVLETPGHTPGGVSYYFPSEKLVLTGDTLFAGSVGRTDFPGGDMAALRASLPKLAALPPETHVVPGHGPETSIAAEVRDNPFLA